MLKKYTQEEYDDKVLSTFFHSFFAGILLVLFFWFLGYFISFDRYCTSNGGQYLIQNEFCYIDGNYFDYIADFEKYIFEKNLQK